MEINRTSRSVSSLTALARAAAAPPPSPRPSAAPLDSFTPASSTARKAQVLLGAVAPANLSLASGKGAGEDPATETFDGSTPAPGTVVLGAWNPVDAPVQGDPDNRNAATYDNVINQFAVGVNPRYTPRDGTTFCNIFAWDVTRAMGAEIPHYVDPVTREPTAQVPGAGRELDANGVNRWLNDLGPEHGWREVGAEEAQALANEGHPGVASWNNPGGIGHIGVVRPGELNGNGPELAQAGARNFNDGHVFDVFPRNGTQFFVNDTGRAVDDTPQPPANVDPATLQMVTDEYQSVLRRDPDADGLSAWATTAQGQLDAGASKEDVAAWLDAGLRSSDERKALDVTDEVFQTVLNRDVSGSRGYWHDQAVAWQRDGASLDEIRSRLTDALQNSTEYRLQHVDDVVTAAFQETLGRTPDANDSWHQLGRQMVQDGSSLGDVDSFMRSTFTNSDEYQLNHLDALVNGVYHELLNRDADPTGLDGFTAMAEDLKAQGESPQEIHDAISDVIKQSDEYRQLHSGMDASTLGSLSARYESNGNPGTVSSGVGDPGGVSYGAYQFATNTGSAQAFVNSLRDTYPDFYAALSDKTPGTAAFSAAWRQLAAEQPDRFLQAQHDRIATAFYAPVRASLEQQLGMDFGSRSQALNDVLWSTAVQHGQGGAVSIFLTALAGRDPNQMSDADIIRAVYAERGRTNANGTLVHFSNSSPAVQQAVANRFRSEQADALAELQA